MFAVVRGIPAGAVATYGQVAEVLGHPGVARHVGNALAASDKARVPVPWHRVVAAGGKISTRGQEQRRMLEAEGVAFTDRGKVQLSRSAWSPQTGRRPRVRAKSKATRSTS